MVSPQGSCLHSSVPFWVPRGVRHSGKSILPFVGQPCHLGPVTTLPRPHSSHWGPRVIIRSNETRQKPLCEGKPVRLEL